jgi:phosphoribosylamine---glycine ligase
LGIPCIGPTQSLARLESSKAFTRDLLARHKIPGNPAYRAFTSMEGIEAFLKELGDYVVKPDGLTGGKGVKLSDAHLYSINEAAAYCQQLLDEGHPAVVIEEKLDGEEFSLMSFCDGTHVSDMVVVQDHKRAGEGDTGPNTGGMGSYSCADHSLPFLLPEHVREASAINRAVARALASDTQQKYKGILYGGFMATAKGLRLLEYNARFGDPETLNVLSILKTDLADICEAIIEEKLDQLTIAFEQRATVCKYLVPEGYPDAPIKGVPIDLSRVPAESRNLRIYQSAVEPVPHGTGLSLTGSRAIAVVGIGDDLNTAQKIAEEAAMAVVGPVYHRKDIGTPELIQRRIAHMKALQAGKKPALTAK